jgi:hypothetical protein
MNGHKPAQLHNSDRLDKLAAASLIVRQLKQAQADSEPIQPLLESLERKLQALHGMTAVEYSSEYSSEYSEQRGKILNMPPRSAEIDWHAAKWQDEEFGRNDYFLL